MFDAELRLRNLTLFKKLLDLIGSGVWGVPSDRIKRLLIGFSWSLQFWVTLKVRISISTQCIQIDVGNSTLSLMKCKQALLSSFINSVSSSLSVYHGPPVSLLLGIKWYNMYIFRVGCSCDFESLMICFLNNDLRHRSIIAWCSSVFALRCLVHIPKEKKDKYL